MEDRIEFWGTSGPNGYLSNFAQFGFELDGYMWFTNEHFYQAYKFTPGGAKFMAIKDAATAAKAKKLGNSKAGEEIRLDWDTKRLDVMRRGLRAKFTQNSELRDRLISTGATPIVESSPVDAFWGLGKDGSGSNALGVLLMELREHFLSEPIPTTVSA